jgi:hypothetical protein
LVVGSKIAGFVIQDLKKKPKRIYAERCYRKVAKEFGICLTRAPARFFLLLLLIHFSRKILKEKEKQWFFYSSLKK